MPVVDGCGEQVKSQLQTGLRMREVGEESPDRQENLLSAVADKTVFQVDYHAPSKSLAVCGNFG